MFIHSEYLSELGRQNEHKTCKVKRGGLRGQPRTLESAKNANESLQHVGRDWKTTKCRHRATQQLRNRQLSSSCNSADLPGQASINGTAGLQRLGVAHGSGILRQPDFLEAEHLGFASLNPLKSPIHKFIPQVNTAQGTAASPGRMKWGHRRCQSWRPCTCKGRRVYLSFNLSAYLPICRSTYINIYIYKHKYKYMYLHIHAYIHPSMHT